MKCKIQFFVIFISVIFVFCSFAWNVLAQEPVAESTDEKQLLIFDPQCQESCSYNVKVDSASQMYEVIIGTKTKLCEDISQSGSSENEDNFVDKRCTELCGYPENQSAPNYRQCISCIQLDQMCRPFDDGSTHCWSRPGAKRLRIEYCLEKAKKCFDDCKRI